MFPSRLLAWGHAMVAELAKGILSDATRVKVERILKGMTVAGAGNWMDDVRFDPLYKYAESWHFVDIEPGGTYKPATNGDIYHCLEQSIH